MSRIAHLSDLHLLEPAIRARRGQAWLRVNYLSLRRALDHMARRQRAVHALAHAKQAGFDHLVVTGDLTEDGDPNQYEVLANVLSESGIPADRITLVPGNHDAYGALDGWQRALEGPLAPWARTSDDVVELDDCLIVPVSTAVHQAVVRSSGMVDPDEIEKVIPLASGRKDRAVVLAQHHAPFAVVSHWVHGLLNHRVVTGLLEAHDNVSVLHGHIHRRRERGLTTDGPLRIFSTFAVADNPNPLRLYEAKDGLLNPVAVPERTSLVEAVCRDAEALLGEVGAAGEALLGEVEAARDEILGEVEALGEALGRKPTS